MARLQIDTHEVIVTLTEAGLDDTQAKGILDVLKRVSFEQVATKDDLISVRSEIAELRVQVADVRGEVQKMKVSIIQWLISLLIAQSALLLTIMQQVLK